MKKKIVALVLSALMVTGLVGCGSNNNSSTSGEDTLKVGMITNSGTIDDKSFNQGTWEGIMEAGEKFGIEKNYMQPTYLWSSFHASPAIHQQAAAEHQQFFQPRPESRSKSVDDASIPVRSWHTLPDIPECDSHIPFPCPKP